MGGAPVVGDTVARRRPTPTVLLVVVVLGALAALTLPPVLRDGVAPDPSLPWPLLVVLFAVSELVVLHIEREREAQTVSISEIPIVLGLFLSSPAELAGAWVLGVLVVALVRRGKPIKALFNVVLVAAEAGVALLLFRALGGVPGEADPRAWLAAYVAVWVATAVGVAAVGLVVAAHDGGLTPRTYLLEVLRGEPTAPVMTTLALVAVTSLLADARNGWLIAATAVLLVLAYRAYASLSDRHLGMERLYRFSQAVGARPELDEVLRSVLLQAKDLLHAEGAEVLFLAAGADGAGVRVRLGAGDRLQRREVGDGVADRLGRGVAEEGHGVLLARSSREPGVRAELEGRGLRDAVVVPLRGSAGVIGTLAVTDRLGDVRGFDASDVLLLETVANHASVALQNSQLIDRLRHDSLHDALTGLANRTQLQRRLAETLDGVAEGRHAGAAVVVLDLDGFKDVNDTLGHAQGDLLLVEVAARLRAAVGEAGLVARLGGDEFALLLPACHDEERALRVGRRVLASFEQPIVLGDLDVQVGASAGLALAPAHAADPATLLKRADMAMYAAKGSTRGLRVYEPELDTSTPRRLALVGELRQALGDRGPDSGEITVHVQPKARLADGVVTGVEALVRWSHPELGQVPPDEFVPVAERTGLIGQLTTFVLDRALASCAAWRREGEELQVAVNLSTRSLLDADLVDDVARLLRRHDVPGRLLTLEITEGSVMSDPARAVALLLELADLGVRLSVDDFGTGYSSLSYLKRLPVHEVKIDKSFVLDLRHDSDDAAIVRSIVDLGRHLGLEVVAEGVEDAETWDLLREAGCALAQGWHLGRPMPTSALLPWLHEHRSGPARGPLRVVG